MSHDANNSPAVAVTFAVPALTAVTTPLSFTVATPTLSDAQLIGLFSTVNVAVISIVSPTYIPAVVLSSVNVAF